MIIWCKVNNYYCLPLNYVIIFETFPKLLDLTDSSNARKTITNKKTIKKRKEPDRDARDVSSLVETKSPAGPSLFS